MKINQTSKQAYHGRSGGKVAPLNCLLQQISYRATVWSGSSTAFLLALAIILVWLISGPIFAFSDTWQLVINTGTTIVTFLMVFLIQRSQNKDSIAIHLKLKELIAAVSGASNRLLESQNLSEDELQALQRHYSKLVALCAKDNDIKSSHSIEEAEERHSKKSRAK